MNTRKTLTRSLVACALAAVWVASMASFASAIPPDWRDSNRPLLDTDAQATDTGLLPVASSDRVAAVAPTTQRQVAGGDNCYNTTPVLVSVPGSTTLFGDNSAATGPDVCQFNLGTVWWESFEITQCASVTFDMCGTNPAQSPSWAFLASVCGPGGTACGTFYSSSEPAERETCPDGNITMHFDALPAGTYYYPIWTDVLGPYQINITTNACTGACCDLTAGTCTDAVPASSCSGPDQAFNGGSLCCAAECRDPADTSFAASNVDLLSRVSIEDFATWRGTPGDPHGGNEAWGYVSPSGREYAIMGFTTGTGFVDVTVPTAPVIIAFIDGGGVDSVWRDMAISGTHGYIVTDGSGVGMQIVDLADIDNGNVTLVNTSDLGAGFATAHNVYVNPDSGYLYLPLPNLNSRLGLVAVDLTDPINPVVAGTWTDTDPNVRCHDLQVVNYDSGPYAGREIAFCFAEGNGLKIADVSDKNAMFTVSTLTYPAVRYTHQGWLTPDRQYVMFGDELDEDGGTVNNTTTYVVDVSNINAPTMAATYAFDTCNIDHNLMVRRDRVYEANYAAGLRVLDASDPLNMTEVAYFDTHPEDNNTSFLGAWGVFTDFPSNIVVVSDRQRGLFVLRDDQTLPPEPEIPTVSEWGLVVMSLTLLSIGVWAIRRRTGCDVA